MAVVLVKKSEERIAVRHGDASGQSIAHTMMQLLFELEM